MNLVETRGLCKDYGAFRALDRISLAFGDGELVSIVGPNGAGKTTFVNLLTGLLLPSSGTIHFKGRNVVGLPPARARGVGLRRWRASWATAGCISQAPMNPPDAR